MGRRLSLIFVMMLLASPAIPVARGQTPGTGVPVPETALPGPPEAPLTISGDLPGPDNPADPVEKPTPKATPKASAPVPKAKKTDPPATAKDPIGKPTPKATPKVSAPVAKAKKTDPPAMAKQAPGDRPGLPANPVELRPTTPTDDLPGAGNFSAVTIEAPANLAARPGESPEAIPPSDPSVFRTDGTNPPATATGQTPRAPLPATSGAKEGTPPRRPRPADSPATPAPPSRPIISPWGSRRSP